MKVKEIDRTANVAWSPATQYPIYLAAGTAAQQLDATFSTSAALDIYTLNLADPGLGMELAGSLPSDHRFHKLVWGEGSEDTAAGMLIGGADNGNVLVWDPDKIIRKEESLIHSLDKHVGAVSALDVNPFQKNLLASGASESEIYLWDLNSPANPMTPGSKSQPPDDVSCLAWNQQVQHILASTYSGRCVVWDLRKNEPIIKVSDSMTRIKSKLVAWHPETATQLCLASEDDHTPVIQLWDLRFATSPIKVLENHQRGILSIAWCPQDPDLLLSCGKDNRILCWNPNTQAQAGEVVYELPTSHQWSFDVQWCPRNPAVISAASFDGHIGIYSLMGGRSPARAPAQNKVADSFPSDPFAAAMQQPAPPAGDTQEVVMPLKKPPKWLRRPCGATFGFGGKLVTFEHNKSTSPQQAAPQQVHISQVVTETDFVSRSNQLESALVNGQLAEFCSLKISNSHSEVDENVWNFLKVNFEKDPRLRYLQLLGYDQTDLSKKVTTLTGSKVSDSSFEEPMQGVDASELAQKMAQLNAGPRHLQAPIMGSGQASPYIGGPETPASDGGAPPAADGLTAFDQIATQEQDSLRSDSPLPIAVNDDPSGLVTQALLTANFEAAVEVCLHESRLAEAVILAIAGGPELLARTQRKVFTLNSGSLNRLIASVVTKDFEAVIRTCDIDNWREALAMALTYAKGDQFIALCDILGSRLESERGGTLAANACLCYICAGNVERLIDCWSKLKQTNGSPGALQDLVEKVMILKKAVELARGGPGSEVSGGALAAKLAQYSELLAAQGSLQTAINYLGTNSDGTLLLLRDRLYSALGQTGAQKPFNVVNVQPEGAAQPQAPQQPASQPSQRQRTSSGYYNAQAGTFQTTTTPTSTYYTGAQPYQASSYGQTPTQPTYSQQTPTPASNAAPTAAPGIASKGPLSSKYPSYPQSTSSYDTYNNTPFSAPYQPYSSQPGYNTSQPSSVPSATQIYNPMSAASAQTPGVLRSLTSSSQARRSSRAYEDSEAIAGAPFAPPATSQPPAAPGPVTPLQPSYQDTRPNQAWNDPPLVRSGKKKESTPYQPPAAITQPIVGGAQPADQGPPGGPSYSGANPGLYNPQAYNTQQPQQQQPQPAAPAPEPQKPVEKRPIPDEHKVLQTVLQTMVDLCVAKAPNQLTKRKLDDVIKKLETLYDRLREEMLSPTVLQGLHQIVQSIQQYDYQTGLAYHTQMISQGNFSEISSFMPGIKILLQTAGQLQVYMPQQ